MNSLPHEATLSATKPGAALLAALLTATVFAALFFSGVASAGARQIWCAADPEIAINGKLINIVVLVPEDQLAEVNGSVKVLVLVPRGMPADIVFVDNTYFREDVEIIERGDSWQSDQAMKVEVRVLVPSRQQFEVGTEIIHVKKDGVREVIFKTAKTGEWMIEEFGLEF